ncbi:MAG: hypothetical protein RLZZ471_865 [Actinomycetota bacterium]|jgi:hypothetical protein
MKKILSILLTLGIVLIPQLATASVPNDIPSVHIIAGSDINLLASDAKIPVRVKNDFNTDLRIHVHAVASNGRLSIPAPVEINIPANTAVNAQIPVKAIGSGQVNLSVWLETFSGLRVGDQVEVTVNVNADAENVMLIAFTALICILGTLGLVRTLRKRRERAAE